jgi:TRAP-type uncharacterized transport system substrate-binding protein
MAEIIKRLAGVTLLALVVAPVLGQTTTEVDLIMPQLAMDRVIAERIVELVDETEDIRINLVDLPEGMDSALEALEAGYADLAFAPNSGTFRESITTVIPLYPIVLHVVTRKDRPATSMEELLTGATVYAGPPDSTPWLLVNQMAEILEFEPGQLKLVETPDSLPDVAIVYAPIDRERVMNDRMMQDIKWFSFGTPEEIGQGSAVDLAVLLNPRLRPFVIPAGTFGRLTPDAVVTVALDNLLVAREDLDVSVVYDIFAEMLRVRPALFSSRPELFQPLDDQLANANFAYSLHPGAIAFLKRDEPTFIERYSGVAEVLVTVLVAIISGLVAVVNIFRIRRKNRLDGFLVDVIEIRNTITNESTESERAEAMEKVRNLQDRAFELLVDEKLAADDSFRIFTELSNDTISRIGGIAEQKSAT